MSVKLAASVLDKNGSTCDLHRASRDRKLCPDMVLRMQSWRQSFIIPLLHVAERIQAKEALKDQFPSMRTKHRLALNVYSPRRTNPTCLAFSHYALPSPLRILDPTFSFPRFDDYCLSHTAFQVLDTFLGMTFFISDLLPSKGLLSPELMFFRVGLCPGTKIPFSRAKQLHFALDFMYCKPCSS